jgi:Flp pilus assembly protein TadB
MVEYPPVMPRDEWGKRRAERFGAGRAAAATHYGLPLRMLAASGGGHSVFANVRWEVVFGLVLACIALLAVGLVAWVWLVWLVGLLGLLLIVGDIAWTILAFARAKRAGESKLKF